MKIGVCKYCGQTMSVNDESAMTQEEINAAATHECGCSLAREERHRQEHRAQMLQDGCEKIEQLFGENAGSMGFEPIKIPEALELMKGCLVHLVDRKVQKISFDLYGTKATITNKDGITVERSETNKVNL